MADISKLTLPSGTTYDIKDAVARQSISDIQTAITGAMHYAGITTTPLTDGSTTNPVIIDGNSFTATAGSVVIYSEKEYVYNGSKWQEFGSTGSLKALAFKDSASGSYKPAGTVSQPTFTGTAAEISVSATPSGSISITSSESGTKNYTPKGTISIAQFQGEEGTVTVTGTVMGNAIMGFTESATGNYTPKGTVSQPSFTGTQATIKPKVTAEGTVSAPDVTVTLNTTTVNSITSVGTLPSCALPSFSAVVANENLTLGWVDGSFNAGTLPSKGGDTTVATSVLSAVATAPTFTGTQVEGTATYTPTGTVSQPTFSGTKVAVTAGLGEAQVTASGSFTPYGNIATQTFNGTAVRLAGSFSGNSMTATGSYTPAGTVSQPTFTGTQATIEVS